jgi:hypothetical protein
VWRLRTLGYKRIAGNRRSRGAVVQGATVGDGAVEKKVRPVPAVKNFHCP